MYHFVDGEKKLFEKQNNPENELQCYCNPIMQQPSMYYSMDAIKLSGPINLYLHNSMDYE